MANTKLVAVTRESVELGWDFVPHAVGYEISRYGPIEGGRPLEEEPHALVAVVYEPKFADTGLDVGARYVYALTAHPDPDYDETRMGPWPGDVERVRVRTLPQTEYTDCLDWFERWLRPTIQRKLSPSIRWCEKWWLHPEALYVVDQLWQSFEAKRPPLPPAPPSTARAEWLVSFLYPLLDRLMTEHGPFEGCAVNAREMSGRMHYPPPMDMRLMLHRPVPSFA